MKLAIFCSHAEPSNGWGIYALNFCKSLKNRGISFRIFLSNRAETDYLAAYGIQDDVEIIHAHHSFWKNRHPVKLHGVYDAVLSITDHPILERAHQTARKYNLPFIMGVHGTFAITPFFRPLDRFLYLRCLKDAKLVWAPSSFTRSTLANMVEATTRDYDFREKTRVIHCGVEFDRYHSRYRERDNSLNLVGVGSVKPRKGYHHVIEALHQLKRQGLDARYTIIGSCLDDAYLAMLKGMIDRYDLADRVIFTGELLGDALLDEVAAHHIYIHTPPAYGWNFEGFGIVYLEANSMGLPVIASNIGGVTSAVQNRYNGLMVEDGDAAQIAQALAGLANDRALYESLSKNALEWAAQHDWPLIVDKHLALYQEVLK